MRTRVAVLFVLSVIGVFAISRTSAREELLHGRRAFVLENARMRVSTLPGGGFIGEVRLKSDDPKVSINVMRVPHYQTIDPFTYDIKRDGERYGTGMQRRLMSGYMGHFVTFPHFGRSSDKELDEDYGQHGEAIAVEWQLKNLLHDADRTTLAYGAELPKTRYRIDRTITLPDDETVAYVDEAVENLEVFGRPMQWVQHISFGPPFVALGKNFVDGSVAKVAVRSGQTFTGVDSWPRLTDAAGGVRDLRAFTGRSSAWLMDGSGPRTWFTMYNVDEKVLVGYVLESAANRWVFDWQEFHETQEVPWNGQVVARGICIGNSIAAGLQTAVKSGSQIGTPVVGWIDARARLSQRYAVFLAEIPTSFRGVDSLTVGAGTITMKERETGRDITLKASLLH